MAHVCPLAVKLLIRSRLIIIQESNHLLGNFTHMSSFQTKTAHRRTVQSSPSDEMITTSGIFINIQLGGDCTCELQIRKKI